MQVGSGKACRGKRQMSNYQSIDAQPMGMSPADAEALPRQPGKSCCDSCQISCLKGTDACFPWYK